MNFARSQAYSLMLSHELSESSCSTVCVWQPCCLGALALPAISSHAVARHGCAHNEKVATPS